MRSTVRILCWLAGSVVAVAAEQDPRLGDVAAPVPSSAKAERALSGTWAWPAGPVVAWEPETTGFAHERVLRVPPVGQHPRVLFAPEDIPALRERLALDPVGRAKLAALRALLAKGLEDPATYEGACWKALIAGDVAAYVTAERESPWDHQPLGVAFRPHVPGRMPATTWGDRHPLLASLQAKAFVALIDYNPVAGREVAVALATWAQAMQPRVAAARSVAGSACHGVVLRGLVPGAVALAYDWAWPWMDTAQRERVRTLLVTSTVGTFTWGMDLPPHWRGDPSLVMDHDYALKLFAIEGEPGDDPRGRERFFEVLRDRITFGHTPQGFALTGVGSHTAGYQHLTTVLAAYASRGRLLMTHPRWRRMVDTWLVHTMQPFGGAWISADDDAPASPALAVLRFQKWFFPVDPGVDFVLRNHPQVAGEVAHEVAEDDGFGWITTAVPATAESRAAAVTAAAARAGGGLTYHDAARGSMVTRSGWGVDDLVLQVGCGTAAVRARPGPGDCGQFTLAALGRAWAGDGARDSIFPSVVTVDGRGQGAGAPPGQWLGVEDTPRTTTTVVDAAYAWHWQWASSCITESAESLRGRGCAGLIDAVERMRARVPLDQWAVDPAPHVHAFFHGFATHELGDPRLGCDEDAWPVRAPWYPVQKAFRTVTLARGAHPYVLVMDDVRKDDAEHLYEWRMNAGPEVAAVSIAGRDVLLGDHTTHRGAPLVRQGFQGRPALVPQRGDRLLLVRALDIANGDDPSAPLMAKVATVAHGAAGDERRPGAGRTPRLGTQVVIGARSVEPRFLLLLYPHRQGEAVPDTTWNEARTYLTLRWPDHHEAWDITMGTDGRRRLTRRDAN